MQPTAAVRRGSAWLAAARTSHGRWFHCRWCGRRSSHRVCTSACRDELAAYWECGDG